MPMLSNNQFSKCQLVKNFSNQNLELRCQYFKGESVNSEILAIDSYSPFSYKTLSQSRAEKRAIQLRFMAQINESLIAVVLVFILLAFAAYVSAEDSEEECPKLSCNPGGPIIRFPFRLKGRHPDHCGYAGFELSCTITNDTILQLPEVSANFSVQDIDYRSQKINVRDSTSCFPRKLNTYNFSSSPFKFDHENTSNVTLFNCSRENGSEWGYSSLTNYCPGGGEWSYWYFRLHCTDDSRYQVISLRSHSSACFLFSAVSCIKMYDVLVTNLEFYGDLSTITLNWFSPNCKTCEEEGNKCILKKNSTESEIECLIKPHTGISTTKKTIIVLVAVLGSFSLAPVVIVLYRVYASDKAEQENQLKIKKFLEDYKALKPSRYSYAFIKRITNEFKDELGQGAYGTVFKGKLSDEIHVAVKILNSSKGNGEEFINEVGIIGKIHHVNVVRLVGFCADGLRRALVYEYLPNGSLEKFVSSTVDKSHFLGWKKLHDVVLGVAKGIEYLHQGCDQRILHFDIKPHNVLLDQNFNPKITDFGLAKLCSKDHSIVSMTTARGTMGYIAPEVFSRNFGNVSYKSDVYSFGMLLLEMVGGRKNVDVAVENSGEIYFPEWIYNLLENEEDLRIQIEEEGDTKIAKKLAIVGLKCIQWHPVDRPSMKNVVQMLEAEEAHLSLPPNLFASTKTKSIPARKLDVICESEQEIEGISELE